jgi:hypothetical protein
MAIASFAKGVKHAKIYAIDLRTKIPYLPTEQTRIQPNLARRVKGKRGRGARGKTIVFGLLKRGYKVYTQIMDTTKPLLPNQWVETNQLFLENYLAILAKEAISP